MGDCHDMASTAQGHKGCRFHLLGSGMLLLMVQSDTIIKGTITPGVEWTGGKAPARLSVRDNYFFRSSHVPVVRPLQIHFLFPVHS